LGNIQDSGFVFGLGRDCPGFFNITENLFSLNTCIQVQQKTEMNKWPTTSGKCAGNNSEGSIVVAAAAAAAASVRLHCNAGQNCSFDLWPPLDPYGNVSSGHSAFNHRLPVFAPTVRELFPRTTSGRVAELATLLFFRRRRKRP